MDIRTGLVPLFRPSPFGLARRPARPVEAPAAEPAPTAVPEAPEAAPEEPAAAQSFAPEDEAPFPELPPPVEPPPLPARLRKKRLIGGSREAMPPRQKLSDVLVLWRGCDVKACRRAKRCLGVRGAACLAERSADLDEAVRALIRAAADRPED